MILSKSSTALVCSMVALALSSVTASRAAAAVFTSAPPELVTEGEGPLTWSFASDAPGTIWGAVTWKVSTESEWHMCGGPVGTVTFAGLPAGQYWVEIADEVDLAFAGAAAAEAPFARCSEAHLPALGPLHPVTLAAVTVTPQIVVSPTSTDQVSAIAAPAGSRCDRDPLRRGRLKAALVADRHSLARATSDPARRRIRTWIAQDKARLRTSGCRG